MNIQDRRTFLRRTLVSGLALTLPSLAFTQSAPPDSVVQKNLAFAGDKGPQLDPALVQEFVRRAHFDLSYVTEALAGTPQLAVASWDWGGGDYETGLGAASHVGNRAIAELLLQHGARPNLFSAAMLGQLEVVRGFLTALPTLIDCKGPHGLSLIHHARKGGAASQDVLTYLENFAG